MCSEINRKKVYNTDFDTIFPLQKGLRNVRWIITWLWHTYKNKLCY